jgi:Protein of unknown function (DUF1573)
MRKLTLFFFLACVALYACKNDNAAAQNAAAGGGENAGRIFNPVRADGSIDSSKLAIFSFETDSYDFGTVKEGEIVLYKFKFTNIGRGPLVIYDSRSSCGCTIPEAPENAIDAGGTGEITVKFNSEGRLGPQRKLIFINANTYPAETRLLVQGVVEKPN